MIIYIMANLPRNVMLQLASYTFAQLQQATKQFQGREMKPKRALRSMKLPFVRHNYALFALSYIYK